MSFSYKPVTKIPCFFRLLVKLVKTKRLIIGNELDVIYRPRLNPFTEKMERLELSDYSRLLSQR